MWRDIALTNTQNLHDVLLQLEQHLAHIRENLRTRELQEEFDRAHELFEPPTPEGRLLKSANILASANLISENRKCRPIACSSIQSVK